MDAWRLKYLGVVAAVMACLFLATSAMAAQKEGALTFSPMIGGYVFEGNQNLDDDLTWSLGIGYNITKTWATELVYNQVDTETDPGNADVEARNFRLDALYHFMPDMDLVPYLAAGIGAAVVDPDEGSSDSEWLFNYGAGLKYYVTEAMALRGDVRHIYTGEDANNLSYTAGLIFQFAQAETPSPRDSDGDGVDDERDQCPDTPRGVKVDSKGCPLDSDGDGVPDHQDECPDTPEGAPVDDQGCALDSDNDGVPDYLDQCPNTVAGVMVDEKGCTLKYTLHIEFEFDKAEIQPRYHDDLRQAADFIKRYQAPKILIAGHTDNIGEEDYNKQLSQRRAASVRQYLIENFDIQADRLAARGYGQSRPIAPNTTPEGRQQNRRVEIICCVIIPD